MDRGIEFTECRDKIVILINHRQREVRETDKQEEQNAEINGLDWKNEDAQKINVYV